MDCLFIDSQCMLLSTAMTCGPTVSAMTEPPRPPGAGNPEEPPPPSDPYAANDPSFGSTPPPPPPYGAPQPPGYGTPPPGYAPPPSDPQYGFTPQPGYAPSQDDRTWTLVAHFGGAAGSVVTLGTGAWIVPLIAMLAKGPQSPVVRAEAVKALNFQLLWSVVAFVGWVTVCLSWLIVPIAMIISIVFGVIAGVRATNNQPYNYPLTYSLIK
jgi:uncharacterized protein